MIVDEENTEIDSWLKKHIDEFIPKELETYIYNLDEVWPDDSKIEVVRMEWDINNYIVSVEIRNPNKDSYYHQLLIKNLNDNNFEDNAKELNLNKEEDWKWLSNRLEKLLHLQRSSLNDQV